MGFETFSQDRCDTQLVSLKIPYGIWNDVSFCSSLRGGRLKIPYGIWNGKLSDMDM